MGIVIRNGPIAVHHTATVDEPWDGPAAVAAMPNDKATLHYCHAWETADAGDEKSGYKFPHHRTKGGPANLAACRNGLARLENSSIPEGDKAGVKAHLQAHLDDADKKDNAAGRLASINALLARARRPRPGARAGGEAKRPWEIRNAADADTAEVWLYDEIGGWGVWASEFAADLSRITASQITVRLNSSGGDYFDGVAIANSLASHPARIQVMVDGMAASIASVIMLAGDEVVMGRGSQVMIHNASALTYGQASDLRQTADLLDKISGTIAQLYADRSGTPVEDWQARMDAETWFTADEAVAAGLADSVAPIPEREQHGRDPDEASDSADGDETLGGRAAASGRRPVRAGHQAEMRPVAQLEGQEPTVEGVGMPANASASSDPAPAGSIADAASDGDGEPGEHPDAAILGQALSWWLAVDQLADRALAQISATLGVPNPDVDTDLDLPPLPAGVAGLSQVLGMFTSADTVVDGAQVVLAKACGIPNPDPDADDGGDEPDGDDGPTAHADSPPVTATTAPAGATDPPDTGAAADDWSAITAHLTTASPDPADVLTALRGAFL